MTREALSRSVLLRCFLRTYAVGMAYNPRGLQNIGFIYALEPGLFAIHGGRPELRQARLRYARHFNSHPFFTPLLAGLFLRCEADIAQGNLPPAAMAGFREVAANTLSALGDSFFGGSLLVCWGLLLACLAICGQVSLSLLLALCFFVTVQVFRFAAFWAGFSKGVSVLGRLRQYDLINWGDRIKLVNAILLVVFLSLALPAAPVHVFGAVLIFLLLFGWVVGRLNVSRVVATLVLSIIYVLMDRFFSVWIVENLL